MPEPSDPNPDSPPLEARPADSPAREPANAGAPDEPPLEPDVEPPEAPTYEERPQPITPRNMAILFGAVVAVAVIVIGAVLVIGSRADKGATTPRSTAAAATESVPSSMSAPRATTPAGPETTTPTPDLPARPYEVAVAKGPNDLAVYARPGDPTPTTMLPAAVKVGKEQKDTVAMVTLVRDHPSAGWLEVYLPTRPNGSTGFVRAGDVTLQTHDFHIEVSLGAFDLKAYQGDRLILDAPIAEAAETTPTPGGLYYTNMLLQPPDPGGPFGTYAYGLSGYSDTLTQFDGGPGQLGIHGTNEPQRMGQKVSHGCIRLRNQDIEALAKVLPLGVPVVVKP